MAGKTAQEGQAVVAIPSKHSATTIGPECLRDRNKDRRSLACLSIRSSFAMESLHGGWSTPAGCLDTYPWRWSKSDIRGCRLDEILPSTNAASLGIYMICYALIISILGFVECVMKAEDPSTVRASRTERESDGPPL